MARLPHRYPSEELKGRLGRPKTGITFGVIVLAAIVAGAVAFVVFMVMFLSSLGGG